jgi:hypothetical protein
MFARFRRIISQFLRRTRTINNEPLNKVSLIVIILIDIFILVNVFTGLSDISQWHLSPNQAYPCYSEWQNHRARTTKDKDYEIISNSLAASIGQRFTEEQSYKQLESGHLGKVSPICLNYAQAKDKVNKPPNWQLFKTIDQKQQNINKLKNANSNIRAQYDSTLLESIAGQSRDRSINQVAADKAKQELDKNNRNISSLETEISDLKKELIAKPESTSFLAFLKDNNQFQTVDAVYKKASFWYPTIQLGFQSLFLIPLIIIALSVHRFAVGRQYGLIALISWHLLVIFFIPLIIKVFEFLQIGIIFEFVFKVIQALFGGLLFLVSYVYILLIPLVGFGIIKFVQKIVLNPQLQATSRFQKVRCVKCAKKIRQGDAHCPHCGYYQYTECPNCQNLTYKHLSHCKHCGHPQDAVNF